jgi:uncharacterized protein YxeA
MVDIMKRVLLAITTIIFVVSILSGCNHKNDNKETVTQADSTVSYATENGNQKSDDTASKSENKDTTNNSDKAYSAEIDFSEFE